jgi:hypothetical protein
MTTLNHIAPASQVFMVSGHAHPQHPALCALIGHTRR